MISLGSSAGRWLMAAAVLASSMAFIDGTALTVALPALQRSLGAGGTELFWVLNAYLLMLAALILVGGVLGDRLGRKRVYMWGIVVFMAGSAACGCAGSVTMLIIFRVIQGAGGALMIPGSLSLLSALIAEEERGKAIGTWSAFTTVVTVGGPILGGALADAGFWREIFFINLPLGVGALAILWRKVPESKDESASGSLDVGGATAVALGLALLTFGCLRIPAEGWGHWSVWGTLTAGVLLMGLFLRIERRRADPMMPLSLFANPVFTGVNLLTFFFYAGLGAAMLFISLDMVQVQGYRQLDAGLSFLPLTLLLITLSRPAGKMADRHGPRVLLIVGPGVAGVGMLLLSFVGRVHGVSEFFYRFFPGIVLFGLGLALTVSPLTATVMGSVGRQHSGVASGINNALSRVAGVFANAVFGALAVVLFTGVVEQRVRGMALDARDRQAVVAEAAKLGDAKVPEGVKWGAGVATAVEDAYKDGFVRVYAVIMRVSAGLAFAGAMMAVLFVKKKNVLSAHE
jgi:EmrB/QacA subfamily drug resistance transporter